MNKVLTAEEILQQFKPDTRTAITQDFAWGKEKVLAAMEAYKNQSSVSDEERAIAFAEWILEHEWYRYYPDKTWVQDSGDREYTTAELYQIFKII